MSDPFRTDTFADATRDRFGDGPLWRPWMGHIRLRQARDRDDLQTFLRRHTGDRELCWDIETKSLFPDVSEIVGHSIAFDGDEAIYIPVRHKVDPDQNLDPDEVFALILAEIQRPDRILAVYNALFELSFLRSAGIELDTSFARLHDVMIMRWLFNSDDKRYNLKDSARLLLGKEYDMLEIREVPGAARDGRKRGVVDFSFTRPSEATLYAAADVIMTLRVERHVEDFVATNQSLINEMEHRLIHPILCMERNALTLDRAVLERGRADLLRWADVLASELYAANDAPFALGSNVEMARFLRKRGVPLEKTETGQDSTAAASLDLLMTQFPVVSRLQTWRSYLKELGTYVNPLLVYTDDNRSGGPVRLVPTGGATGRFCSKKADPGDPRFLPINGQSLPSADRYEPAACRLVHNPPEEMMKSALHYGGIYELPAEARRDKVTTKIGPGGRRFTILEPLDEDGTGEVPPGDAYIPGGLDGSMD